MTEIAKIEMDDRSSLSASFGKTGDLVLVRLTSIYRSSMVCNEFNYTDIARFAAQIFRAMPGECAKAMAELNEEKKS